jgi:hypothetical protein
MKLAKALRLGNKNMGPKERQLAELRASRHEALARAAKAEKHGRHPCR